MQIRHDVIEAQARAAEYKLKVFDIDPTKDLASEYKRLAKVADQRLVRIEGYRHEKGYEAVDKYAYNVAMRNIRQYSGEGAKRFHTKMPDNPQTLEKKINDILLFLNSPTSTKKGIQKVYQQKADTFNKMYDADLTWQELSSLYSSKLWAKIDSMPYRTVLHAIGQLSKKSKDKKKDIINELKAEGKNAANVKLSDEDTNKAINEFLGQYADDLKTILK